MMTNNDRGYPPYFEKERTGTYLELAKMSQESFFNRRSYEWKIAFGLWTAIGVVTYFAVQNSELLSGVLLWVLGFAYLLLALLWTFVWQPILRHAFDTDKKWQHYYMHKAEGRDADHSEKDPWCKWPTELTNRATQCLSTMWQPWSWVQSIPTVLFLLVSFIIIAGAHANCPVQPKSQDKASVTLSGQCLEEPVEKVFN